MGEDWYNINLSPSIFKPRAWALNEGCCVDEYMYFLSFFSMVYGSVVAWQEIDSKMGAGWMGKEMFAPPLLTRVSLVPPQYHPFQSFHMACDGVGRGLHDIDDKVGMNWKGETPPLA